MRTPTVLAILLLAMVAPAPAAGAPPPGNDPTCGTGQPVTATSGAGDPQLPSLQYAALKTGFRAVIAWETDALEPGRIRYSIDGGATQILSEPTPRRHHLFVIDGLPIGRSLCFTPLNASGAPAGGSHAFRTANAMNAHDGAAYTLNLLVLANQVPHVEDIEGGLDEFARKTWDATDGNVRVGRAIIVVQDLFNDNSGWKTCYLVRIQGGPLCKHLYDVIFTYDFAIGLGVGIPLAATYRDGITDPHKAIWMNMLAGGGHLPVLRGDVGHVLLHEVGHYAFGAQDLYGPDGQGPNCWDPVTEISVMGNNFGATEFDDDDHPCPPGSLVPGHGPYVPSYTGLRHRYPLVPHRLTIDEGPHGDGGAYVRSTIVALPASAGPLPSPRIEQDDAGSGGDAGNFLTSATPIEPGILYHGVLLSPVDGADIYRFEAPLGSAVEVAMYPRVGCFDLLDASGSAVGSPCVNDGVAAKRTATGTGGTLYIKFALGDSPSYHFGVGLDEPAPGLV